MPERLLPASLACNLGLGEEKEEWNMSNMRASQQHLVGFTSAMVCMGQLYTQSGMSLYKACACLRENLHEFMGPWRLASSAYPNKVCFVKQE